MLNAIQSHVKLVGYISLWSLHGGSLLWHLHLWFLFPSQIPIIIQKLGKRKPPAQSASSRWSKATSLGVFCFVFLFWVPCVYILIYHTCIPGSSVYILLPHALICCLRNKKKSPKCLSMIIDLQHLKQWFLYFTKVLLCLSYYRCAAEM